MKIFTAILLIFAIVLIIFNITLLDFSNLFEGDSLVGLLGIISSLCAIFILLIFRISRIVMEKTKNS